MLVVDPPSKLLVFGGDHGRTHQLNHNPVAQHPVGQAFRQPQRHRVEQHGELRKEAVGAFEPRLSDRVNKDELRWCQNTLGNPIRSDYRAKRVTHDNGFATESQRIDEGSQPRGIARDVVRNLRERRRFAESRHVWADNPNVTKLGNNRF